jgi:hypothetical protein
VGILKAIKSGAPSVKRVVITSSFVSVMSNKRGVVSDYTYTDKDWNPVTEEEALDSPQSGYQGELYPYHGHYCSAGESSGLYYIHPI